METHITHNSTNLAVSNVRMELFPERDGNHGGEIIPAENELVSEWRSSLKGMETFRSDLHVCHNLLLSEWSSSLEGMETLKSGGHALKPSPNGALP